MSDSLVVPVIDLSGWPNGDAAQRRTIAAELDAACRTVGFLQVVGHGIPPAVIDEMQRATAEFFGQPESVKRASMSPKAEINRGYAGRGDESLSYSLGVERPVDLFEAFNIGPEVVDETNPAIALERHRHFAANIWPDDTPSLRPALLAYWDEVSRVSYTLLDVFAAALDLPDGWFRPYVTHSTDTMRVIHYITAPGDPDPTDGQQGMGAHSDYGILTVLFADAVQGLQIVGPDGEWHDVVPRPDALLVNLGDLTATWTNDRWRSTLHRVRPPARLADRANHRRSVAFFRDGNHDAVIECIPTCASADNPPRYRPVTAGEHLMDKLLGPRTLKPTGAHDTVGERRAAVER